MLQLYKEGRDLTDLEAVKDTVVDVLSRPTNTIVSIPVETTGGRLEAEPIAINVPTGGWRGFGKWGGSKFYEVDVEGRRVLPGPFPFRDVDKCGGRERQFLVRPEARIEDFIEAFREAGFEILGSSGS